MNEQSIFIQALQKHDPAERAAFLDQMCAGDAALRQRLERLLQYHEQSDGFLKTPTVPWAAIAELIPERPGAVIGPYKLMEQIGEGGMGLVFVAEQQQPVRRRVALKIIKPGMDSRHVIARFEAERQALALMDHQNIAKVLDAGTTPSGRPYFVMELVHGIPITTYCDANQLTPRQRLELFIPVCLAIQHAHQKGIIHRDIKPSNILVTMYDDKAVPKVIDFGVAKAIEQRLTEKTVYTQFGMLVGTFEYMSPEQAEMNAFGVDTRSDIYSLGVLLYELLTGTTPLERSRLQQAAYTEIVRLIKEEEPPRPSARLSTSGALAKVAAARKTDPAKLPRLVRRELDWVVMKCLEKQRTRRYDSAGGLARDVERYLNDEPIEARPPSAWYRFAKFGRRNKVALVTVAVVAVSLVLGTAVSVWQAVAATRARADLAAKNAELADEQAKVQARFELAQKAIALFHTGVSEDVLLTNPQFKELRTRLLKEASGFYGDLENLLEGQTDVKSRRLLAEGFFQLGELTEKIGSKPEALKVHRKALAVRRELAAAPDADVPTRLDVARSLGPMGKLLLALGDSAGALAAFEEQRNIAQALEAESPTDAVRQVLGSGHNYLGWVLRQKGKPGEALESFQKAASIRQQLADANPAFAPFQSDLAGSYSNMCNVLMQMGNAGEALAANEKARAIQQKLVDANPTTAKFQVALANYYDGLGAVLGPMGKVAEALAAYEKTREIRRKLVEANPSVTDFQWDLSRSYNNIGSQLLSLGKTAEALAACEKALEVKQKIVEANPTVIDFQNSLARSHLTIGAVLRQTGETAEALAACEKARAIQQKLADANPSVTQFQIDLAASLNAIGGLLSKTGDSAQALAAYEKALVIQKKLADANSTVPSYQSQLAASYNERGRVLAKVGRFPDAFASLETGRALLQKLVQFPRSAASYKSFLGQNHGYRGWALWKIGRSAEAAAELRRAVALWSENKDLESEMQFERARTLALLAGLGSDAKSGVSSAEADHFADQAVAALRDVFQAGWSRRDELKEREFDALRKRADFQKLVKELEAKMTASRTIPEKQAQADKK
jgi:serine/threonine protein kinase/tetratricopeptide (TPR) repeat protein